MSTDPKVIQIVQKMSARDAAECERRLFRSCLALRLSNNLMLQEAYGRADAEIVFVPHAFGLSSSSDLRRNLLEK